MVFDFLREIMQAVLGMSISAAAVILLTLTVRRLTFGRISKRALSALWLIPLAKLFIYTGSNVFIDVTGIEPMSEDLYRNTKQIYAKPAGPFNMVVPSVLPDFAVYIWLMGAALLTGIFIFRHMRMRRRFSCSLPCAYDINRLKKAFGIRRKISLRVSDMTDTPFTYGVISPVIILPKTMDMGETEQLENVLCHELAHIKRLDVLFRSVMALLAAVHWFDPLVWVMLIMSGRDAELACDETAVIKSKVSPEGYAMTLIGMEEQRLMPQAAAFTGGSLEERVREIMKKDSSGRLIYAVLGAAALIGAAAVMNVTVSKSEVTYLTTAELIQGCAPYAVSQYVAWSEGDTSVAYAYAEEGEEAICVSIDELPDGVIESVTLTSAEYSAV